MLHRRAPTSVFKSLIGPLLGMGVSAFLFAGCAYTGGYGDRGIPGGYSLLAVPVFRNATIEVGSETYFTNALIRELERSKVVKITPKSEAQATLEGNVESVSYVAGSKYEAAATNSLPTQTVLTTSYTVKVRTRLTLRRNSDQAVLWSNVFEGERVYNAPQLTVPGVSSANATYNHSARHQTIAALALDMMAEAHDRLTESFW
ncbi:MAG: LPS assembly lipoprotein LptE [Bdellovibrionaceae bacterium]|nr:LPS assembly lipoprotein LptE [Pseudobdellovibrionaceae bacterium]